MHNVWEEREESMISLEVVATFGRGRACDIGEVSSIENIQIVDNFC